ncbi:MAG TPA: alkaline phosphatase PafA [Chitinophagaceae bacterium]|nr:alkaline phosphatase PafA [Chitinophagaceae bacterium]
MKYILPVFLLIFSVASNSQTPAPVSQVPRPKLIVGIAVDQMRWDFLYRFYERYSNDGFKRILNGGVSCENMTINYTPSVTGVGHATLFSGAVPAMSGITGNEWIDQLTGRSVYCVGDSTVDGVGANSPSEGKRSPRNLLVTNLADELRLATNFQSRVIGVSLKDRAAILPSGHLANAAFWFDDPSGRFISSTYYMQQLPDWVVKFNALERPAKLVENGWTTLYPINSYKQSDTDTAMYEGKFSGETSSAFPHDMKNIYAKNRGSLRSTPYGNTLTLEFALAAIDAYQLGKGKATDFLTINFASTDAVGHMFGPNSIEAEDTQLRLDKDLATLMKTLDAKVGKGQWLLFLSADHGVSSVIGFNQRFKAPGNYSPTRQMMDSLNKVLNDEFKLPSLVRSLSNYQVNFDQNKISSNNLDFEAIKKSTIAFLQRQPAVLHVVDISKVGSSPLPQHLKTMISNGYQFKRSGSIQIILNPGWFDSPSRTGTTHGSLHLYDIHLPLLWYGWNIKPGRVTREVHMNDVAPTLATMLRVQTPSGSSGNVITEIISNK